MHHQFEACCICTVRDATGSNIHCWVVDLFGVFKLSLKNVNQGLAFHKDFCIFAGGSAKQLFADVQLLLSAS